MQTAPTVHSDAPTDQNQGALKRRARGQNGPVGLTPNSAERKPKGRKHEQHDRNNAKEKPLSPYRDEPDDEVMQEHLLNGEDQEVEQENFTTLEGTMPPELPPSQVSYEPNAGQPPPPPPAALKETSTNTRIALQKGAPST